MAKKTKQHTPQETVHQPAATTSKVTANPPAPGFSLFNFRTQAIILALISIVFYCNTFKNEYAFDDMMAIVSNDYVQKGVAGIGDIMTQDAYQSYLEHKNGGNQLAGGRYRPLSLVTFAIEQQLLGVPNYIEAEGAGHNRNAGEEAKLINDMHFRHVVNVLLYALSVVVLLVFLSKIVFPRSPVAAFVAALLFAVHPIHTEVVANVKSRDEILSVLFISLTYILAFRYKETQKRKDLIMACLCFFLALLSKEYAATLLVLMPLSFFIFRKETVENSIKSFVPYLIPFGLYILLRLGSVSSAAEGADKDIMNNPYLYATGLQKIATEIMVLLDYLKLLFFPHPLTADYSYNQIPYTNFSNPVVWLSVLVYVSLAVAMGVFTKKRHLLGFAIAIYLANLALISNIFFNIGAPMGERLIYHSSIGFAIAIAWLLSKGSEKLKPAATGNTFLVAVMVVIIGLSGFTTISRNTAWTNNNTLFLTDVKTSPNSVLANTDAGSACMSYAKTTKADTAVSRDWLKKAIGYFDKAISINPGHMLAFENRGLCYFNLRMPDKALTDWDTVRVHAPGMPNINNYLTIAGKFFFGQGMEFVKAHNQGAAIEAMKKAADAAPDRPEVWYNLGGVYNEARMLPEAKAAYARALKINPNDPDAQRMYAEVSDILAKGNQQK